MNKVSLFVRDITRISSAYQPKASDTNTNTKVSQALLLTMKSPIDIIAISAVNKYSCYFFV